LTFFWPYPRFILLDKTRIWLKKGWKRFLDHIRVLSFWIKRGYDSKKAEKVFWKPSMIHPSVCPSATHPSVRPSSIRQSVSAFYPNPEKMLDARKNFRREKKFQKREKMLDARKNVRREKKFQTREKMLDARKNFRREKKC
jgi:hypothetical protein